MNGRRKKEVQVLIHPAFSVARGEHVRGQVSCPGLSKEDRMRMNYLNIRHLLEDVEWDFHGGPPAPYGDWAVETREEFCYVAAAVCRLSARPVKAAI